MPATRAVTTLDTIALDTPLCFVGDEDHHGRDSLVLFSDRQREVLQWVLNNAEVRHELMLTREQRRRWSDSILTRVAAVLGAIVLLTNIALNIWSILRVAH